MKGNSRAARLARACAYLRDELAKLQVISDDGEKSPEKKIEEANAILESLDFSEIECLRDEIQSWKENIEEKFSATQKYSDLEECEQALEDAIASLEDANHEVTEEDEIADRISELEGGLDSCDGVSFPGMYR